MSLIEQRESHYKRFLGPITDAVMHSTDIKPVHVDIYTFPPTPSRSFYTLITGGMSDQRQNIPPKYDSIGERAEIMTYAHEPQGWMYNVLKGLAEMPSEDDTFLHWYHTVPNGKAMTAEPSELTAFLFVPPYLELGDFSPMILDGDKVDFLVMVPIKESELAFTREYRVEAMLEVFDERDFDYIIDEGRPSFK